MSVAHQGDGTTLRLVCRDGKLVGANLYGDTTLAAAIKSAIESGTRLAEATDLTARLPPEVVDGCRLR
jgi:NAD(P)H-nitrite reductase large subunit